MKTWALRVASVTDTEFLFRVYASTRLEELALTGWDHAQTEAFLRMQFAVQDRHYKLYYPDAQYSVIEASGTDAGRFYVHRRDDEIRVMDIAILPHFQRRGLGGALMRAVLQEGERSGRIVSIHVERNNPALQLYQRLGFTHVEDFGIYKLMHWRASRPDGLRNEAHIESLIRLGVSPHIAGMSSVTIT